MLAEDILLDRVSATGRVVVLGAGLTGCEVAFKLREAGLDVTLAAARDDIMMDVSVVYRHTAVARYTTWALRYGPGSMLPR